MTNPIADSSYEIAKYVHTLGTYAEAAKGAEPDSLLETLARAYSLIEGPYKDPETGKESRGLLPAAVDFLSYLSTEQGLFREELNGFRERAEKGETFPNVTMRYLESRIEEAGKIVETADSTLQRLRRAEFYLVGQESTPENGGQYARLASPKLNGLESKLQTRVVESGRTIRSKLVELSQSVKSISASARAIREYRGELQTQYELQMHVLAPGIVRSEVPDVELTPVGDLEDALEEVAEIDQSALEYIDLSKYKPHETLPFGVTIAEVDAAIEKERLAREAAEQLRLANVRNIEELVDGPAN